MSCAAETLHLSRVVYSQIVQLFLLLLIIVYGHVNSHVGPNAFLCCSRYDVADILCVTRCMVSLRASVLLSLELLFFRDGSFSCSLLSSHDIDELIDIVCTS